MAPESCFLSAWSLAAATVTGPTVGFNGMLDSGPQAPILGTLRPLQILVANRLAISA